LSAAIMLQGTGSEVGKSLLTTGLCRAFTRRGLRVRPFKAQNMSNNAAVTADGGEIGRAQALQARACGAAPTSDMNPVLLKPQSDRGAQIVLQGRVVGNAEARAYQDLRATLLPRVMESYRRLATEADLMLVEGAGSPAEVNLRAGDIANMGFAEAADLPVILIGDIERGGVIAQLVGTHLLLPSSEQARLCGYIVNKFRGDPALFAGGLVEITRRTAMASLGVVPWFADAMRLPAEDAVALGNADYAPRGDAGKSASGLRIAVLYYPNIANFDDLDPLRAELDVRVLLVRPGEPIPGDADLVILPGSKATIADLAFLRGEGWDVDLLAHRRRGGAVLGICGGYQMLGRLVRDPDGIEGRPGEATGLGLLDIETSLTSEKRLVETSGYAAFGGVGLPSHALHGYEMHMGRTSGADAERPFLMLANGPDGALSADGRVIGCYLHGLFATDGFRHALLARLKARSPGGVAYEAGVDKTLDRLADHLEAHLDLARILVIARGGD
jgi:adenosylcobyric acid synthase